MRFVVVSLLSLATCASASAGVESLGGYHERVGIPTATRIRAAEEARLAYTNSGARIVGGSAARPNAHPYLAGLLINFANHPGTSVCGSALVSAARLVTAAQCWFDGILRAERMVAVLGTPLLFSGGSRIVAAHVAVHPKWNPSTRQNDVAVVYLPPGRVILSREIQPIALPTNYLTETFAGEWAVAVGYGKTSDEEAGVPVTSAAHHVRVQVIGQAHCRAAFGHWAQPTNVCTSGAHGAGLCGGDSGSPLVALRGGKRLLVGVGSFIAAGGCEQGHPSAFSRVTSFHDFIAKHL